MMVAKVFTYQNIESIRFSKMPRLEKSFHPAAPLILK